MAKSRNQKGKTSKPSVKVGDIKPGQDPKGGFSKVDLSYKSVPAGDAYSMIEMSKDVVIKK